MDRVITYAGAVPLETDLLNLNRNAMKAIGWLTQGVFGTGTFVTDVTVVPATPAALSVVVNPGQIFSLQAVDPNSYSSLTADTSHTIIKQGLLVDATPLAITPPGSQSQVYLIQAGFSETDTGSTTLPYYNPAQPAVAWSGPTGLGGAQFTVRQNRMLVTAKPGSVSGSPITPTADAGYVGLYTVTIAAGATTITSGNIAQIAAAPMLAINGQLPLIPKGVQDGTWNAVQDTGTANALVITPKPPASSYVFGQGWRVRVAATNTAGATINASGLGVKSIVRADGTALSAGDLIQNAWIDLMYDGTNFMLVALSPSAVNIPLRNILAYATPGTFSFTVPAGIFRLYGEAWGGGGGGGGTTAGQNFPASGGGAGSYAAGWSDVTPGQVLTITVGSGGQRTIVGTQNAAAGGTSSIGSLITAGGGGAGNNGSGSQATQGAGGTATGGQYQIFGESSGGTYLGLGSTWGASKGGSSPKGGTGGIGSTGNAGGGLQPGGAGGGGGSGTNGANTGSSGNGGAGGAGLVLLSY